MAASSLSPRGTPAASPHHPATVVPDFDLRRRDRGIGVVVPFDFELDRELWRWTPEHCSLHLTRTSFLDRPIDVKFATQVSDPDEVATATADLSAVEPAITVYACTSGSYVAGIAGEQRIREAMLAGGAKKALTTSGALLTALAALGVHRLAIATPYDADLTSLLAAFCEEAGYEVVSASNLGLRGRIADVSQDAVLELAQAAAHPAADVLFLSCTNLHTLDTLPELESRLDMPVLSANLVTMWAALRAIGELPRDRRERLFLRTPEWEQIEAWDET